MPQPGADWHQGRVQFHLAQLAFYVLNLGKGGLTILLRP